MNITLVLWLYILLAVSGLAFFILIRRNSTRKLPLPPGRLGWPIIGESLELQRLARLGKHREFVDERRARYNRDMFKTSILGEKTIIICGAAGNKFIFTSEKNLVLTWWPPSLKKLFGNSFFTAPYNEAIRTRKMIVAFLHQEVMDHLVERFDQTCKKCMECDWIGNNKVLAFSLIKKCAFYIACDMFASMDDPNWRAMMIKNSIYWSKGCSGYLSTSLEQGTSRQLNLQK
ncbi:hypothetical protein Syun_002722 [Stephania yunnanensis]|uniref:Cytochrome P450 n=1 Tax=Stephania yunnanensis TaxID=152371 RepID=A0AAP0LI86_9MAGN